jgi:hypothetical protein
LPKEIAMNRLLKSLLVAGALAGTLSACATYDYGYGYSQPYYGYDASAYAYDYGYAYPYWGYSPGYYVGPSIGFDLRYRDHHHHEGRHWNHDGHAGWNGDGRTSSNWSHERGVSSNWSGDRRTSSNRTADGGAAASAASSAERRTVRQGAIPPMRERTVTGTRRGTRIAPAPPDNQRAQAGEATHRRPEVHAEQRG